MSECNIQECQLLRLKEDLGLIVLDKSVDVSEETFEQVSDRFAGIEPLCVVRDYPFDGLGRMYFRGVFICDTLENVDYLIASGTRQLKVTYSSKFRSNLPEIVVPGRSGLRIHAANTQKDLRGCIAVGVRFDNKIIAYSSITLDRVRQIIKDLNIRYIKIY